MPSRLFLSPPHLSGEELSLVHEAFASNYIAPVGPMVDAFEAEFAEYTGISHAVAVSSGTAAMHLALRLLGVGPGDEVITSTLTFIGSVTPATFQGAVPVFVDADRATWNMDPSLLAEELDACRCRGRLPKAVVPTDLYGQCCDMDRILEICSPYGIPVVTDSAEAVGATYKGRHAGVGARAAVFSFNGNKIITTSGGGMLCSDDGALIEKARFLSQQARDPASHYEHSTIGYNYRLSNVLAAIGRGQLRALEDRVRRKREIFAFYRESLGDLPGIELMPEAPYGRCTRWLTVLTIDPEAFGADREAVRKALEAKNIEARPVWKPMHLQPVFSGCRVAGGAVSEELFARGLCLPSGTAMTDADLERVVETVRRHEPQGMERAGDSR
ncbi:MAG: aminotransferase class I/II-fold pyridoxal phosphate-dependent enzyme [Deferrisomatales bacterium]|nr:aminotransferase class I/II-fold pyridoxal phosphate-dependent enzyme [Deferrisomatales bacterium]